MLTPSCCAKSSQWSDRQTDIYHMFGIKQLTRVSNIENTPIINYHHSPCEETSQWPYVALKDMRSLKRLSKPDPTFGKDHLKPASLKRWICSFDSFVLGFWLFWIFLYATLSSLHHFPREPLSPCLETSQWPYFAWLPKLRLLTSSIASCLQQSIKAIIIIFMIMIMIMITTLFFHSDRLLFSRGGRFVVIY